jgi:glucosamine-6-phosphate deaminase
MEITICPEKAALGATAARDGAARIREAVAARGAANIIVATGASQFEMLGSLAGTPDLPWEKVGVFHLDEYVGLPVTHPASFRRYLWERFHRKLPRPVRAFHYLDAESDPERECARASALIAATPIDVAFIGIGENGHIAFNDPPADFETETPYIVVRLDDACRRQQLGEGWFPAFDDVPDRAVSMSVRQILKSEHIVCTVPDRRKATAVRDAVRGPVTPDVPASALQNHASCHLYLDPPAASELDP